MGNSISRLRKLNEVPQEQQAFNTWLEFKDALEFLKDSLMDDEFVLYAQLPHVFIDVVLVPESLVTPPDVEDLMEWDSTPSSSWGISYTFSEPPSITVESSLEHARSKTLSKGEQLVFDRSFEGRVGQKDYFEILQKLVHVLELHFLEERSAYCRLTQHGDIEDVIRIIEEDPVGSIVTIQRESLDRYMALCDLAAVQMFDFTRFRLGSFNGWSRQLPNLVVDGDLSYRILIEKGHASYIRGIQIVRPLISKLGVARLYSNQRATRQYESFIAHDFKNQEIREISCAPGKTANYFTKSTLPFEMSPAFFRPDVLLKYKTDSDKYCLSDRSIFCRGGWQLEKYDVNEAGQVHAYIVYLRRLPYEEQRHWKAYNEAPKAPISKRAIAIDFEGRWDVVPNALSTLKGLIADLGSRVPWWTLRSEKLMKTVNYPVTSSADEWANELLLLDQLIVEGFETKYLRQKAIDLGRTPDRQFASLKLIEECLIGLGFEEERAREITKPLHQLHSLRSKLKGHASGGEAVDIKRHVLAEHGTYRQHFDVLCQACDEAIRTIRDAFKDFT